MARQRVIKPDFFTDEQLAQCTPYARLLFAGLWCLADKRGRLRDQPPVIHGAVFPFEPAVDVDAVLGLLQGAGFIVRYAVDGKKFIQVKNFERHQRPHPKEVESQIPAVPALYRPEPRKAMAEPRKATAQPVGICSFVPSESESESVGGTESREPRLSTAAAVNGNGTEPTCPPAFPPEQRAEDATRAEIHSKQLQLGALLAELSEHARSRQTVTAWCREVTSYESRDGGKIRGASDYRTVASLDRLDRSIEDARWWLEQMNGGRIVGDKALVDAAKEVPRGTR